MLDWDRQALLWINGHHWRWLDAVLIPVSSLGEAGALWFGVALALLTCHSRPYLGMRYPGDVLAGSLLGIVMGCAAVAVERRWQRRLGGESQ